MSLSVPGEYGDTPDEQAVGSLLAGGEPRERTLDGPEVDDDLYHSRGNEVTDARPLLTGDVLDGLSIPGLEDGAGMAIVLTHPCTMRKDGVALADRLYVARVRPFQYVPPSDWPDKCFRHMPLPALSEGRHSAAFLADFGMVASIAIEAANRLACLSDLGINLLQQRLIYCLTRFVAPVNDLRSACMTVFDEVDLHEEWADTLGQPADAVAADFHTWVREGDEAGRSRQSRLADPMQAAAIRREMRRHLA